MTPSGFSSVAHLVEEGAVVVDADMLEHADRDDAVEALVEVAVVLQLEMRRGPRGPAARARSVATPMLLGRQRHAVHVDARRSWRDRGRARPSRSRCRAPSGRASSASLAAMWRFLASCASSSVMSGPLEIGAGILHVLVEEEPVELAGQIVMVLHVAPRARRRVDLMQRRNAWRRPSIAFAQVASMRPRAHVLEDDAQQRRARRLRECRVRRPCRLPARPASDRRRWPARLRASVMRMCTGSPLPSPNGSVPFGPVILRVADANEAARARASTEYSWTTDVRPGPSTPLFCLLQIIVGLKSSIWHKKARA